MDKKLFSSRLMLEGLRQTRLIGIIGMVVMLVCSVSSGLLYEFDRIYESDYSWFELNPFIMLVMFLVPMTVILSLFGFMNKRNACDFYHAVPFTRTCIYLSFFASAIVWCFLIISEGTLISALFLIFHGCSLFFTQMITMFAISITGCIYMCAVAAFSMTITGTYLTNVCVAIMLVTAPRCFIGVIYRMLAEATPFIVYEKNGILFDYSYNVVFGVVEKFLESDAFNSYYKSILYTLVLSAVFFVSGLALFVKRKSESATKASVNRVLQCVFRIIPAMLISIIPIAGIFDAYVYNRSIDKTEVIVAYAFCVLVYFLYELITTRKFGNLLRALPTFLIVILANLAIIFGLRYTYNKDVSMSFKAENVEYVIVNDVDNLNSENNTKIYNDEIKKLLCELYDETVKSWNNKQNFYYNFYHTNSNRVTVTFHCNSKDYVRVVAMDGNRFERLCMYLSNEKEYVDLFYSNLLKVFNNKDTLNVNDLNMESGKNQVLNMFVQDIKEMPFYDVLSGMFNTCGLFSIWQDRGNVNFSVDARFKNAISEYCNAVNNEFPGNRVREYYDNVLAYSQIVENKDIIFNETNQNSSDDIIDIYSVEEQVNKHDTQEFNSLSANIDFYVYTIRDDYSLQENESYFSCYLVEEGGKVHSEYTNNNLKKLADYLDEKCLDKEITKEQIVPGAYILKVYVSVYNDMAKEELVEKYPVLASRNWIQKSGIYIVDKDNVEVIKNIESGYDIYY